MKITFKAFSKTHFPLMLKWLNKPHIKQFWDQEITYTEILIGKKYTDYVNGYKIEDGEKKNIHCYIIYIEKEAIGYIQLYNAYDFINYPSLINMPKSLATIDFFIGNENYLGKGIGKDVLEQFNFHGYKNVLVDPDATNIPAIKTYERAGFIKIKEQNNIIWMLKKLMRNQHHYPYTSQHQE